MTGTEGSDVEGSGAQSPADDPSADTASSKASTTVPSADSGATRARPSAASRARRIGGGAASAGVPRPRAEAAADDSAGAAAKDGTPVRATTSGTDTKKPGSTQTSLTKSTATTASRDNNADDAVAPVGKKSVTLSVPPWLAWVPPVVFALVAAVFLALFVSDHVGNDDSPVASSKERQQVLASAKTCLATLNTYNYTKLDAAQTAGVACTTGRLTTDYKRTMTTIIKKNAPKLQAEQIAKINTAGIESVSPSGKQFTVLLYAQLNVSSKNSPKGRIDPFAASAIMQKVGDKWLIAKINTVSSLSG